MNAALNCFACSKPAPTPAVAWNPDHTSLPENVGDEVGRSILRRGHAWYGSWGEDVAYRFASWSAGQ
jgi:hypothetical protein